MDFSNRHTNEFVNLCDLENVLGGGSVCYAGGNTESELLLRKSLKNIVIPDSAPESEVGEWINEFVSCHCERSEAIHSCHSVLDTESEVGEWTNANKNTPRHICESTKATSLCHAELCLTAFSEISDFVKNVWFSTASYQRGVDNFNVNTFLKQIYTFITGQILSQAQNDTKGMASFDHLRHCCTCQAIRNSELTLVNSELKNPTHYSQFTTHCISIGGVK